MNVSKLFQNGDTYFHKLDGSVKLILLIFWSVIVFSFMDYRVFLFLIFVGFIMLSSAKINIRDIRFILLFITGFTLFNSLFLAIITPQYGSELTESYTSALSLGVYNLTYETLFFVVTLSLKYFALLPVSLLFVFTTNPSEFASSLNKIKVHYKISFAVSLSLRYIPDVMSEYNQIKNALTLKGIDFDGEKNKVKKLGMYKLILVPLVRSSIEKIDTISNGMDLRSFGLMKNRTWYTSKKYGKNEYVAIGSMMLVFVIYLVAKIFISSNFYYPFI